MKCCSVSTLLVAACGLQLIFTLERQIFDFLGFMYGSITVNLLNIIIAAMAIFGVCLYRQWILITYACWCIIYTTWNLFVICLYLNVGSLTKDRNLTTQILGFGTGASWWFDKLGPCDTCGDKAGGPIVEVLHAVIQILLSICGLVAAANIIHSTRSLDSHAPEIHMYKVPSSRRMSIASSRAGYNGRNDSLGRVSRHSIGTVNSPRLIEERDNQTAPSDPADMMRNSKRGSKRSNKDAKRSSARKRSSQRERSASTGANPWISVAPSNDDLLQVGANSALSFEHQNQCYSSATGDTETPSENMNGNPFPMEPPPPIAEGPGPYTDERSRIRAGFQPTQDLPLMPINRSPPRLPPYQPSQATQQGMLTPPQSPTSSSVTDIKHMPSSPSSVGYPSLPASSPAHKANRDTPQNISANGLNSSPFRNSVPSRMENRTDPVRSQHSSHNHHVSQQSSNKGEQKPLEGSGLTPHISSRFMQSPQAAGQSVKPESSTKTACVEIGPTRVPPTVNSASTHRFERGQMMQQPPLSRELHQHADSQLRPNSISYAAANRPSAYVGTISEVTSTYGGLYSSQAKQRHAPRQAGHANNEKHPQQASTQHDDTNGSMYVSTTALMV